METTQTGGLHPRIVPSKSRFGTSGLRYGHFSLLTPGPSVAPRFGPKRPKMGLNRRWRGRCGLPRCLNCHLCAPNGLRGVMDLARGPLGAFRGRFWPFSAVFGPFWAAFGQLWTPSPPPLVGPPRGPIEGFCPGIRLLNRACVGEERRNLACGLARSQNIFFRNPWREVLLVACLLVLIMGREVW